MMAEELAERLKYIEYNKTEYKVLGKLIEKAIEKGKSAQQEQIKFKGITQVAYQIFFRNNFIGRLQKTESNVGDWERRCTIGVDGSFQLTGGTAGLWFAPVASVRVILREGINSIDKLDPEKDLDVEGDILVVDERKCQNVHSEIERRMLEFETKAIMITASENKDSVLMIDGPIVDPPTYKETNYVKYRCDAIKNCLDNGTIVVGCVKRIRDNFLKKHFEDKFTMGDREKVALGEFPTDLHLMSYIFTYMRVQLGIDDVLFTQPIETSEMNTFYKAYKDEGVRIFSFFIQKDIKSLILRLDVPIFDRGQTMIDTKEIAKLVAMWTYPELGTPLPVYLADEKCEVRKGCADVLYEEILTKMRTTDPFNQIASSNLR